MTAAGSDARSRPAPSRGRGSLGGRDRRQLQRRRPAGRLPGSLAANGVARRDRRRQRIGRRLRPGRPGRRGPLAADRRQPRLRPGRQPGGGDARSAGPPLSPGLQPRSRAGPDGAVDVAGRATGDADAGPRPVGRAPALERRRVPVPLGPDVPRPRSTPSATGCSGWSRRATGSPAATGCSTGTTARPARVDWVSGACFLVRREAWDAVGGFDPAYFMYMEDVDLCWRLARAGWAVGYEPAARVRHEQGASTNRHPYRMLAAHHRSMWRFAWRTTDGPQAGRPPGGRASGWPPAWPRRRRPPPGPIPAGPDGRRPQTDQRAGRRVTAGDSIPSVGASADRYPDRRMGKASSSKKVARAAGTGGGRTHRGRTPWTYYGVIAVVVILGIARSPWASRDRRLEPDQQPGRRPPPTVGTVWNEGYAVDECGKFAAGHHPRQEPGGITTGDGDGIIHIHPTTKSAAGKNATLGKFADAAGMKLNAAELQLPGGKLYHDGDTCQGKTSHVYVKEFAFAGDTTGTLQNVDPRNVPLQDQSLLTIAFVPASEKNSIPPPPAYVDQQPQQAGGHLAHAPRPPSPARRHREHDADDGRAHLDDGEEVVQAVVLVGGEGTRLRPLTLTTPKQMLPVGGRPMIERVLAHLAGHGVDEVVLSLGYRPDAFIDAYPDGTVRGRRPRLRGGGCPARHRRGDPLRGPCRRHRRHVRGRQRRRAHRPRRDRAGGLPPRPGRRGHHRPHTRSRTPPRSGWYRPTRRAGWWPSSRSRRPAQAPTNLINAGTYVLEPSVLARIPTAGGSRSSGRPSRPSSATGGSMRLGSRRRLGGCRARRPLPGRQPPLRRRPCPVRRAAWPPTASVVNSVLGEGVIVGAGRGGRELGAASTAPPSAPARRCGPRSSAAGARIGDGRGGDRPVGRRRRRGRPARRPVVAPTGCRPPAP